MGFAARIDDGQLTITDHLAEQAVEKEHNPAVTAMLQAD
jgi:hypothetical protein